ncbi:MAG: hypothetical protein E6I50_06920 [Chloroflexi bacterium]|nr:MAG: hypothetical protein E6I50_06920 [Chloroflexota bacterium]
MSPYYHARVPRLTNFLEVGPTDEPPWLPDEQVFPTRDGARELRLAKAGELRMGLTYWSEMRLVEHGRDITDRHPVLLSAVGHGPVPLGCLEPWSTSGENLAVTSLRSDVSGLQEGFLLYDLTLKHVMAARQGRWGLRTCAWSPTELLVLAVSNDGAEVVGAEGKHGWRIGFAAGLPTVEVAGWTESGRFCFWNAARLETGTSSIRFVEHMDGGLVAEEDVDPMLLLPYDAAKYASLSRDEWVLVMGRGTRGIGRLLDGWSLGRFDPTSQRLELGIYRPTSDPYPLPPLGAEPGGRIGQMGCSVGLRWVSMEVGE